MITHAEYAHNYPLPYFGASSITTQIDGYMNQQEWLPVPGAKRRPRQSRDDLRRTKCIARYHRVMHKGPISVKKIAQEFHISQQAVKLKMREYLHLNYIKYDKNSNAYEWIAPIESLQK